MHDLNWPKHWIAVKGEHMYQLFSPDSEIVVRIFRYLVDLDQKSGADGDLRSLLILLSILDNHSLLAPVCRDWSELLSRNQPLYFTSLHMNAFGCHGTSTEVFTRCKVLKKLYIGAWSLDTSFCRHTITEFLRLPWRLRVAGLNKYLERDDTFSPEIFGAELACAQNFLTPHTIALLEHSIAEFSEGARNPIEWRPVSRRRPRRIYMQYQLLNFKSARHHDFAPDEFIAWFRNVSANPGRDVHREQGYCCSVTATVQLSSILCLPPQQDELKGTCMFTFRDQSFEAKMILFFDPSLDLTFDFIIILP